MLSFLGNGSAFADEHNSAFFIAERELVIIDCPATAFPKIKKMPLGNIDEIYVLITHTHGDHCSGLGTLLQYVWFMLKRKLTVVAPSEEVESDLLTILKTEGCIRDWFNILTAEKLNKKWFVSAIPTYHVDFLKDKCFGYCLNVCGNNVVYTGDTRIIEPYLEYLHEGTYFYTEIAYIDSGVHLHIEKFLPELVKLTKKGVKVFVMHLDNEKEIENIIKDTDIKIAPLWKFHRMKLKKRPFGAVSAGYKTIELRLLDEKRKEVKKWDCIEFSLIENQEMKIVKFVTDIYNFPDFKELYKNLPLLKCGFSPFTLDEAEPEHMNEFYSPEKQKLYSVIGIQLEESPMQKYLAGHSGLIPDCSGYEKALAEIRSGIKTSHWIWYIFPQIRGLTNDYVTEYYALDGKNEALEFYNHEILGKRLTEITNELLNLPTDDPVVVFGRTDAFKLRACMTLFSEIAPNNEVFEKVIEKFCMGTKDEDTLNIISETF